MSVSSTNLEPVKVTFVADDVEAPTVIYNYPSAAIKFLVSDSESYGRVTFETLDSISINRGEILPYPVSENISTPSWIYEAVDSDWMRERHLYECQHYGVSLIDTYRHYVFEFHDQYIEAIAEGIWVDQLLTPLSGDLNEEHPLNDLSESCPTEQGALYGIKFEIRTNPKSVEQLIDDSRLCSQKLFQFYVQLDNQISPSYAAVLRTQRDGLRTRFASRFSKDLASISGVAKPADFMKQWSKYLAEVNERRSSLR